MNKISILKTVFVLSAVGCTSVASAQENRPAPREIIVTGEAHMAVAPELVTLTLGVRETADEAKAAMALASKAMVGVIDQLVKDGIAPEDMQTSQLNLAPIWEQERSYEGRSQRQVVGFEASNMLTVRVRDLDQLGGVLDRVLDAGANNFQGLQFKVADPSAVQDQLRAAAVTNAIAKAEQLAAAAGVTLGAVRQISDQGAGHGGRMMAMEAARSDFVPIAAGELDFRHSVSVTFDIVLPQ